MLRNTLFITLFSALFILNGCGGGSASTASSKTSTQPSQASTQIQPITQEVEKTNTIPTIKTTNKILKTIDLLVLVDKNDKNNFNGLNETKIDHFISVTNKVYENSGLDVKLNIKKIQAYTFNSNKTSDETLYDVYTDKKITQIKNDVKADLVITYRKYANDGYCGVAYVNHRLDADVGYAHVSLECPSTTTAHEIGHSMGLTHSQLNTHNTGVFNYARGYGTEGEFVTIMGYESTFHTKNQMFNYSSPSLDCRGYECGVDSELDNGADAVKALKYAIDYVADFR